MAKASADCVGESHGGFATDGSDISGFSHMVRFISIFSYFSRFSVISNKF